MVGSIPLERAFFPSSYIQKSAKVLENTNQGFKITYRGGDWSIVCRSALCGEAHAVRGLELDLKGGCG